MNNQMPNELELYFKVLKLAETVNNNAQASISHDAMYMKAFKNTNTNIALLFIFGITSSFILAKSISKNNARIAKLQRDIQVLKAKHDDKEIEDLLK